MPSPPDLYALIDVAPTASLDEIRRARRAALMRYHPDKNPDDPRAESLFKAVDAATQVLLDPARRAAYDRARVAPSPSPSRVARERVPFDALPLEEQLRRCVRTFEGHPILSAIGVAVITLNAYERDRTQLRRAAAERARARRERRTARRRAARAAP